MTETIPLATPGIKSAGEGSVYFLPAVADPESITLAEFAAGVPLSCTLDAWNPTPTQNAQTFTKYCMKTTAERAGTITWQVAPIRYEYDPTDLANPDYPHVAEMTEGRIGFLVDRRGYEARTAAVETGQTVALVLPVELGVRAPVEISATTEGATHQLEQQVFVIGEPTQFATVAAA